MVSNRRHDLAEYNPIHDAEQYDSGCDAGRNVGGDGGLVAFGGRPPGEDDHKEVERDVDADDEQHHAPGDHVRGPLVRRGAAVAEANHAEGDEDYRVG